MNFNKFFETAQLKVMNSETKNRNLKLFEEKHNKKVKSFLREFSGDLDLEDEEEYERFSGEEWVDDDILDTRLAHAKSDEEIDAIIAELERKKLVFKKGDIKMKENVYKRIQEEAQEDVPEIIWNWLEQNGLDPVNGNFNIDDETDFYFESKPILDKYGKERTKEYRFIKGEYEADSVAKSYIIDLLDDIGISGFNVDISDFVDEDWFESAIRESYEFYVNDIANEDSSDPDFKTRLEQEMAEKGVDSPEELVDYLVDQAGPDYIESYKNDFGESEFSTIVKNNNLVDEDKLVEYVLNQDGRGSTISGYNGVEIELNDEWFAYRTN
jgi:hypothetical protein